MSSQLWEKWPDCGLDEVEKRMRRAQQITPALAAASTLAPRDPAINNAVGLERPPPS